MGIVDKLKDKLHIGSSDEKTTTGSSSKLGTSGPISTHKEVSTASKPGVGGTTSSATGQGVTGAAQGAHATQGVAQGARATQGVTQGAHTTSGTGVHGAHTTGGVAQAAQGVHVQGGQAAGTTHHTQGEAVTIHETDPNWQKARDLTQAAEYQSKVSAAKAYEAEAYLVGAHESHEAAQQALNAKAHLAAQAEAEKRNIGQADYVHREYDHAKKVQEDHEKHRIEINKNLDTTKALVADKEKELNAILPSAQKQQAQIDALAGKLGAIQDTKTGLENKEAANAAKLRELEAQKGQIAGTIESLEANVLNLNRRAEELERQAAAARQEANAAAAKLRDLKGNVSTIAKDQDAAQRSLQHISKDLEAYRAKEADLARKLQEAQVAAKNAADAAAAKEAELQLARQQFEAERAKGQPVEQEIEKYRKQVQEKEHQLTEAMESSKAAKAAYEKFLGQANEADKAYKLALAEKERKISTYTEHKQEAEIANSRATEMWSQAKKYGNTGDANALQRLAEAEKTLQSEEGLVSGQLVAPNVGPKQPTTEGPKFTRTEDSKERNEDVQKEDVRTRYA